MVRSARCSTRTRREDVARPLYEGGHHPHGEEDLHRKPVQAGQDPNLIASMSGHSEGSRAFARARKIDDEMKKELVNLLD